LWYDGGMKRTPAKTTKKTPTSKKVTVSARSKKLLRTPAPTWRFFVVAIGIFLVAVSVAIVMGLLASHYVADKTKEARLDRINDVYTSLKLDDSYQLDRSDVFGDKRVYTWDKGRTYSSVMSYMHGDTVSNTVAELDAKIKDAGFMFIDEPYPGSTQVQYHYKSSDGEYIRLSVASKQYNDAWRNAALMGVEPSESVYEMDKNAGPATVTIKVNLDDNNE